MTTHHTPTPSGVQPQRSDPWAELASDMSALSTFGSGGLPFPDPSHNPPGVSQPMFSAHPIFAINLPATGTAAKVETPWSIAALQTQLNLAARVLGKWTDDDDMLFAPHTGFVIECLRRRVPLLPVLAWKSEIEAAVVGCETELQKANPVARLHKGAIYFNVGLCHLESGDIDSAFQMFAAAGTEDEKSGRGDWANVLIGYHALSEGLIIQKVIDWIAARSNWAALYEEVTDRVLDQAELKALIGWLASKHEDAIQFLHALHRFIHADEMPVNLAKAHIQARAMADIILVVESSMRRWQVGVHGQLHARMTSMLAVGSVARIAFDDALTRFNTQFPTKPPHPDRETATGVNWAIDDHLTYYAATASRATRAGLVAYLALRLRNSFMHVIDGSISVYTDKPKLDELTGRMVAAVGLSMVGHSNTIPAV